MGLSSKLDLDELLNYLISGSFFLAAFIIGQPWLYHIASHLNKSHFSFFLDTAPLIVIIFTMALFLGHTFSLIVRYGLRVIQNFLLGDPENAIFEKGDSIFGKKACPKFFTEKFIHLVEEKYKKIYEIPSINNEDLIKPIPRMIRSYVLHHSESARKARDQIVRARSFCANLSIAFILSSLANILSFPFIIHLLLWLGALTLMIKQRSLDKRESQEIYTHFLALNIDDKI